MKRLLHIFYSVVLVIAVQESTAQTRYLDEVFSDEQITVSTETFGTNFDFLTSSSFTSAQAQADLGAIVTALAGGTAPADAFFNPADTTTDVKLKNITMDIYQPIQEEDTVENRPVMIYIHTGNFLPPPLNGSPNGTMVDLAAVELCTQWAKRGYVAISIDYRLGWNPIAETVQERTGTLLNAVYRAIHDVKHGVRHLKRNAGSDNTWGIDADKIVLYGQGSGGYVAQAYTTLDNPSVELFLEKFLPNPFEPSISYVDTTIVGNPDGLGGLLNLYLNPDGQDAEVHMSVNAGGALADESWLEAGDVPMVSFHTVRDDFAPFTAGTVIVPTTQENVVDVHGSNFFIQKANDLGNNEVFAMLPDGDPYTDAARSLYGSSFEASLSSTETINSSPEGLFPVVLPLTSFLTNQASPWEWWDPESPLATAVVGGTEENPITAHLASLSSNPDMSEAKGLTYLDSIQGYLLPRVMCALQLPANPCLDINVTEISKENNLSLYPNPTNDIVTIEAAELVLGLTIYDIHGRLVKEVKANSSSRIEVSMADLKSGFYSVIVRTNSGLYSDRIIRE